MCLMDIVFIARDEMAGQKGAYKRSSMAYDPSLMFLTSHIKTIVKF